MPLFVEQIKDLLFTNFYLHQIPMQMNVLFYKFEFTLEISVLTLNSDPAYYFAQCHLHIINY